MVLSNLRVQISSSIAPQNCVDLRAQGELLKAVLSTCKSSGANQVAAGTISAALKAFEGALKDDYKGV